MRHYYQIIYLIILQHIFLHFTLPQDTIDRWSGATYLLGDSCHRYPFGMEVENSCIPGLLLLPSFQLKGSPLAERIEELPLLFRGIHDSQEVLCGEAVVAAVDLSEDAALYLVFVQGVE